MNSLSNKAEKEKISIESFTSHPVFKRNSHKSNKKSQIKTANKQKLSPSKTEN